MTYPIEDYLTQDQNANLQRIGWDGKQGLISWVINIISSLKAHQTSNPNGLSFGKE